MVDDAEPKLILYGSPGCRQTERAQERLEALGVDYRRVEITALDNPIRTLRSLVGDVIATPVLAVGDEGRIGLDVDWLDERLKLPGAEAQTNG